MKMNESVAFKQFDSFTKRIPKWLKDIRSPFYYFLFLIALGLLFFATTLFDNFFTTAFTGDYCSQQFSFYTNGYDDWWHFFKTGEFILYDENTFLGADNIGSNTFYYLFNPFFLPILLFPRQLIPQGMAILTILKISLSGLAFCYYLRYLGASKTASKITGIAYAFSGWMTWYLWFNHFTEIAVLFPLILLGIEIVLKDKKPWFLMGSICVLGFTNFFFCICLVICAFLYAMFRYFQRLRLNSAKDNLLIITYGFLGFLVGLLLPFMIFFPATMHALTSSRASSTEREFLMTAIKAKDFKNIWKFLTSWTAVSSGDRDKARALYPFIDFIFPVASDRGTPLTVLGNETYDNVAGSQYCFLPMTMLLVPAFIDSFKRKHFSVIVPLVFFVVALFTPAAYYLFHGLTAAYSRWTIFVTTSILAYVGLYLDKLKKEKWWVLVIGGVTILALCIVGGICANTIVTKYSENFKPRMSIPVTTAIECSYIVVLCTVITLLVFFKRHKNLYHVFTGFLVAEIAIMGMLVIEGHGVNDYSKVNKGVTKNDVLHTLISEVTENDDTYYRSFTSLASSDASNDEMRNNYNGSSFFHSIYNYNVADFCNWSSIIGGTAPFSWSGAYLQKRPNVDTVLGMKYYYVEDDYYHYQRRREATSERFKYNVPFEYVDITDELKPNSEFRVYKNHDYIDFALTYDTVYETFWDTTKSYAYENLNTYKTLSLEEMYIQGALVNTYKQKSYVEDLKANHTDIKVENPNNRTESYYYRGIYVDGLSSSEKQDATLTYYDINSGVNSSGKKVNSLGLTAKEYLTMLNREQTNFEKYDKPVYEENDSRRWVAVIEAYDDSFPNYDPKGNIFFIQSSFKNNAGVDIYLVDENNEIVTYDNHNDGYFNNTATAKGWRTFYVSPDYNVNENGELTIVRDAPKIKKIIVVSRNKFIEDFTKTISYSMPTKIYVDSYSSREERMADVKQYRVEHVKSGTNKYSFSTNFEKERIVVTRLAYEDGFTLTMTDENGKKTNVPVFNGQGGFVSFVSGTGKCSYKLEFYTPNLKLGSYVSGIAVLGFISSYMTYFYFGYIRGKEKEVEQLLKLN